MEYIFTLQELSNSIQITLATKFNAIKIKGEVIQPKRHNSGHLYFTLKDGDCTLDCVAWRSAKFKFEPAHGLEVVCTGQITTYSARSKYQLNVTNVEHSGLGALIKLIEERKNRLREEGLFDTSARPKLPRFPSRIGIATSPDGAVIHDMLHRLQDRYPCQVLLYPIPVQGPDMPNNAINAIKYLSSLKVDLIILARGGGSFEDLFYFNDENLVRTVAASAIPIVTAIGHETDTTLVDYASTLRAPTPTAAIELITPDIKVLYSSILGTEQDICDLVTRQIQMNLSRIHSLNLSSDRIIYFLTQKFDLLSIGFENWLSSAMQRHSQKARLHLNKPLIGKAYLDAINLLNNIRSSVRFQLNYQHEKLKSITQVLESLSYKKTLERGFCIVQNKSGRTISSAQDIDKDQILKLTLADASIQVKKI